MALFDFYHPAQRERLQVLLAAPAWRAALAGVERLRGAVRTPPPAPAQLSGAAQYLKQRNGERAQARLRAGETDRTVLLQALADWTTAISPDDDFPILFLGLVLTMDCSFSPRCRYCNQPYLPMTMTPVDWRRVLAEAATPVPPYVYLTGGEPLLLGEELWGDDGLAAFAVAQGCAVNINTNAELITPVVALQLVKLGVAKLHISLDSADPQVQGELFGGTERVEAVWNGIHNMLIARELLGVTHPQLHINCVLTRRNLFLFPALLRRLLQVRKIRSSAEGAVTADPVYGDFAFHLIPVGGPDNAPIRPTAEEWQRFYTETWDDAEQVWQEYQTAVGVPADGLSALTAQAPFANPFHRVDHHMPLAEYCQLAAQGIYWQGALSPQCHLAPSQAFVLPDGAQYWCGAHAIRRPTPLGNVRDAGLRENIRRNLPRLSELPIAACQGCAGATCVINQRLQRELDSQVTAWVETPVNAS